MRVAYYSSGSVFVPLGYLYYARRNPVLGSEEPSGDSLTVDSDTVTVDSDEITVDQETI